MFVFVCALGDFLVLFAPGWIYFIYRIMENRTVFNDAQLHVLEMASRIKTAHGLEELKDQLAAYYARRIDEDMEALWQSGHWNEKKLEELKEAHYRTPYKQ